MNAIAKLKQEKAELEFKLAKARRELRHCPEIGLRDKYGSGYRDGEAHARVAEMGAEEAYSRISDAEIILGVLCAQQNKDQWNGVRGSLEIIQKLATHAIQVQRMAHIIPSPVKD